MKKNIFDRTTGGKMSTETCIPGQCVSLDLNIYTLWQWKSNQEPHPQPVLLLVTVANSFRMRLHFSVGGLGYWPGKNVTQPICASQVSKNKSIQHQEDQVQKPVANHIFSAASQKRFCTASLADLLFKSSASCCLQSAWVLLVLPPVHRDYHYHLDVVLKGNGDLCDKSRAMIITKSNCIDRRRFVVALPPGHIWASVAPL